MDIQDLVREKIIGNIKMGTKGDKGPRKLGYYNVEEDKATSKEMVDIFKKLYGEKPTKLIIMFTSENPFNFKYKRYVNNKVVCIGNDKKAITIGKDSKGYNTQIEVECNKECEQRLSGKCKLVGSLKFVLVGIDAGGVWKINTSGGFSLSNIATEIFKYKKAGKSLVNTPFELMITEQQSLAYGTYYSLELHGEDIKPQLTIDSKEEIRRIENGKLENKPLLEEKKEQKMENKKVKSEIKEEKLEIADNSNKTEQQAKEDFSNYLTVKKFMPTIINGTKFDKIIFQDVHLQDVEYILHPKASEDIIKHRSRNCYRISKLKSRNGT